MKDLFITNTTIPMRTMSMRLKLILSTALATIVMSPLANAQDVQNQTLPDSQNEIDKVEEDEDQMEEMVVTGIRQALRDSRDLKRAADTALDSITASDVSTLPDLSVAEALSRVPGVVAQRFDLTDANGLDFPSPEGGNNLIRGLAFVRSEFNGRETFSADGGRALDFGTVPPELIGSVNVYKNVTADLTEGGIGGTIDLRTLEPFDKSEGFAAITSDATYTDFRDTVTPDVTVTLGDRWQTKHGEFGLLGAFSHSVLDSRIDNFQIAQPLPVDAIEIGGDPNNLEILDTPVLVPAGFQARNALIDRDRQSYYVAGQWQNNEDTLKATAKYFRIENDTQRVERTLEYFTNAEQALDGGTRLLEGFTTTPFASDGVAPCSTVTAGFDNDSCLELTPVDGLFETGVISNSFRDWTGARGARFQNTAINTDTESSTEDISLNVEWRPAEQWFVNLDAHRTEATSNLQQAWGVNVFFSDFTFNPNDIDNPQIQFIPDSENRPARRLADDTLFQFFGDLGDPVPATGESELSNFVLAAADQFTDNEGDSWAVEGDVQYDFVDDGWFDSVQFGGRYSERAQINRGTGLNWASISPPWNGNFGLTHLPLSETDIGAERVDFSDFFGGDVFAPGTVGLFTPEALLGNYDEYINTIFSDRAIFRAVGDVDVNGNLITEDTPGLTVSPLTGEQGLFSGNFEPSQINGEIDFGDGVSEIQEDVLAFYGKLDFGNELPNGMSLDGNIGIRYVESTVRGEGGLEFIDIDSNPENVAFNPETAEFLAQPFQPVSGVFNTVDHWLPSLNLKLNLNDESLIRLAASRNITRPNINQLNAQQTAVGSFNFVVDTENIQDGPTDIVPLQINVFGGNPSLEPIDSWNFDLGFEHYYGDDNFFSVTGFYKDISNNITSDVETLDFVVLDGETLPLLFTGDQNQDDATFLGTEVAYQHFFTELPGVLSHLGVQANYTYIDADTNAPIAVIDADADGQPDSDERIFRFGVDNFLGTSEHTANLVGIYQDEKVELRLAYNYRSNFLVSFADQITGNPIFVDGQGLVDGSAKYNVNENLQFRFFVSNILGSNTDILQQVDLAGQSFSRATVKGDRRIKFGFRYQL